MNAGTVSLLVILGANPVYTAPADLNFEQASDKVALRAHLGLYHDETAARCHWHIPETHCLECGATGGNTMERCMCSTGSTPLYGGERCTRSFRIQEVRASVRWGSVLECSSGAARLRRLLRPRVRLRPQVRRSDPDGLRPGLRRGCTTVSSPTGVQTKRDAAAEPSGPAPRSRKAGELE